ncbi:MAG: tetratricopeptide repeat protein [Pseudomonadota bacterium]
MPLFPRSFSRIVLAAACATWVPVLGQATPDGTPGVLQCDHIPDHAFEIAALGYAEAQAKLGRLLVDGFCGSGHDALAEGIRLLEAASEQGHTDAAILVGALLEEGVGGAPDRHRARRHYGRAADAGYRSAQHRLGMLLITGEGGAQNIELGIYWLGAAAGQGDGLAAAALGVMHARGIHGVNHDVCVALDWFEASVLLDPELPVTDLLEDLPARLIARC